MYNQLTDNQLPALKDIDWKKGVPFKVNNSFNIQDIEHIQQLFSLSQDLLKNYKNAEDYYINEETKEVFIKISNEEDDGSQIDTQSEIDETKLISLPNFQKSYLSPQILPRMAIPEMKTEQLHPKNPNEKSINQFLNYSPIQKANTNKPLFKNRYLTRKKNSKKRKEKRCNCSKSKCLRLHCICFRDGVFCNATCGCKGCYNSEKYKKFVIKVRAATKDINSAAFESRLIEVKIDGKICKFTHGCSCSKNNCVKNYCECKKNGLPCTPLCKCENCRNKKVDLDPALANSLLKKPSRKKKKIIFQKNNKDSIEMVQKVLMNKYRKE
jgi:hypothetical protein